MNAHVALDAEHPAATADAKVSGKTLKSDILRTYAYSSGGRLHRFVECIRSPGVRAVVVLRFGQWLMPQPALLRLLLTPLYFILSNRMKWKWGIDIPRTTVIGEGLYIGHFGGITICPHARLGKNINLSQQVTVGFSGTGERRGSPTIGDDVYIAPGAKLFGKITIGNNVKIGANAVVYDDIPENAVVVLDPGFRIISYKGNRHSA